MRAVHVPILIDMAVCFEGWGRQGAAGRQFPPYFCTYPP